MLTKELIRPAAEETSGKGGPCFLVPNDKKWELCDASEHRLKQAVEDGALLIFNDKFLLKFKGRLAGLALRDDGEFRKGVWYEPVDHHVRNALKRKLGIREVTFDEATDWVEIRDVKMSPEELEREVETGIRRLKDKNLIFLKLIDSQGYLEKNIELDDNDKPVLHDFYD